MLYRGVFWVRSLSERDMITLRFLSDENGVLTDGSLTAKDINHKRIWERLDSVVTGGIRITIIPAGEWKSDAERR